jgi:hypothetical protein
VNFPLLNRLLSLIEGAIRTRRAQRLNRPAFCVYTIQGSQYTNMRSSRSLDEWCEEGGPDYVLCVMFEVVFGDDSFRIVNA